MKKITPKVTTDELWKGIIEALFEDFLAFFFPDFVDEVDFTKPLFKEGLTVENIKETIRGKRKKINISEL